VERDVTILLLRLGLLAVLYFFLFQLLVVMWRDLRQPAGTVRPEQPVSGLDVLEAAASGKVVGETLPLEAVTSLGRSAQNTIILADQSVSAEHALVSYRLGQWWVEDLRSTNGSYLNDLRIEQPTVIHTGDVVRFGAVRLRVRL
jgi:FHA domain